jgi:hypothetical protein
MSAKINFIMSDCEDLSCHTGTTFNLDLLSTEDCYDLPYDLTGYTAEMLIFDTVETDIIDTIVGTISFPTKGIVNFNIPATTTLNYQIGMFNHQIELKISSDIYRVAEGLFEVRQ